MGDNRGSYRVLVERPEVKRPLGKPRCTWESNIKMDVQEVVWGVVDWIDLAYDREAWWVHLTAELNHPVKYEGWNFNSGNYLFTTDTK